MRPISLVDEQQAHSSTSSNYRCTNSFQLGHNPGAVCRPPPGPSACCGKHLSRRGHVLATISRPPQITLVNYCYVFQQLERDLGR